MRKSLNLSVARVQKPVYCYITAVSKLSVFASPMFLRLFIVLKLSRKIYVGKKA
jgi:hypothetical protein